MKNFFIISLFVFFSTLSNFAQEIVEVTGIVQNSADGKTLSNVHIINLNTIKGTVTNLNGEFTIPAKVNDTLYFTFLGFEPQKEVVKKDWVKYGNITVALTEVGIALEEVLVLEHNLTGYLEIDAKNIPIYTNQNRYAIAGLNDKGYEGTATKNTGVNRAVKSILNPITSLYNIFSRKGTELRRLRKVKEDDEIRNLLQDKFDRETLVTLLQVEKYDIEEILKGCNYSKDFIKTANDLQILDAISECYDEYRLLNN